MPEPGVLVVDQNFDLGGRMLHSGSFVSLGGGDPIQQRDIKGEGDKDGYVTVNPMEAPEELDDSIELLFTDISDWSVLDRRAQSPYRYNDRELVRAVLATDLYRHLLSNLRPFERRSGSPGPSIERTEEKPQAARPAPRRAAARSSGTGRRRGGRVASCDGVTLSPQAGGGRPPVAVSGARSRERRRCGRGS